MGTLPKEQNKYDFKFRTPMECSICGHLNFELCAVILGQLIHLGWSENKCKCPKACVPEGYVPIAPSELFVNCQDENRIDLYAGDVVIVWEEDDCKHDGNEVVIQYFNGSLAVEVDMCDYDYTTPCWALNQGWKIEKKGTIHQK